MPMKNMILHIACALWILCWIASPFGWLWIAGVLLWFARIQKRKMLLTAFLLVGMQLSITNSQTAIKPPASFPATIKEIKSKYVVAQWENERILLYDSENISFGDVIQVAADCEEIDGLKNFHQFSFCDWSNKRGITYGCSIKQQTLVQKSTSLRSKIYQHIQGMKEERKNWLLETFYGIKQNEQERSYMVSSSGMHMSFVASLLERFFALWFPACFTQGLTLILILCFGSAFLWKDALVRIFLFRLAALLFPRYSAQDRLGIAMIMVLCVMPYSAGELTFVLPVAFRVCFLFNVQKRHPRVVSLLVLIPLQFYYFNEVDLIQILLFSILRKGYGIAFLLALLYLICPQSIVYALVTILLQVLALLEQFQFPLYYASSLGFVALWFYAGFHWLGQRCFRYGGVLMTLFLFTQLSPYLKPYMEVMMIDVGQGDCTLISLPFHQGNILIDVAGNKHKNLPEDVIVPVLHSLGIRSLDMVIITHDDFDHSGGLLQLKELMEVTQVITKKQEAISFGNYTFSFLLTDQAYADINDNSILTFLEAYDTNMLFMGDASKKVEEDVLREYPNLHADILKVGHHGSKTSSSLSFLHQLHPSLGLISCGAKNFYGHPSPETLAALEQEEIQALATPQKGAVSIKLTNFIRFYKTATDEFGIIKPR